MASWLAVMWPGSAGRRVQADHDTLSKQASTLAPKWQADELESRGSSAAMPASPT